MYSITQLACFECCSPLYSVNTSAVIEMFVLSSVFLYFQLVQKVACRLQVIFYIIIGIWQTGCNCAITIKLTVTM